MPDNAFHASYLLNGTKSIGVIIHRSLYKSRSTLPLDNTSSVGRNAPGVLPVEGIPAATKVNFV